LFLLLLPAASAQSPLPARREAAQSAIRDVTFENVTVLSSDLQSQIVRSLQSESRSWLGQQSPEMLATFIDQAVLQAYEDEGYWRAKVSTQVTWVRGQGAGRQVDARISAISEGKQYWIKDIRWSGATVFPEEVLARELPVHQWEFLDRSRLAAGMDSVRRLYVLRGYLASSITPEMEFDDATHNIILTLAVNEDKLFYFRNLSVEGLDRTTTRQLETGWAEMREQPYSEEKLRGFLQRSFSPQRLSGDPLDYSISDIDLDTHTVDIQLSFDPVTQAEKTAQ